MKRILPHLQRHAVGYVALFVALTGTSYAAVTLPPGSVGPQQIRNHAIDPIKFNNRFINGSVRAWAVVGSGGHVIAGGGKPRAGTATSGSYVIHWAVTVPRVCATIATIDGDHSPATERIGSAQAPATAGYAVADTSRQRSGRAVTFVTTFNQAGQLTALGFDVGIVC